MHDLMGEGGIFSERPSVSILEVYRKNITVKQSFRVQVPRSMGHCVPLKIVAI